MSDKTIHVAVGIIYNDKNQVLIAKRASHLHQGGKWEFPGGKVESGETSQQALIREVLEEVGIQVKLVKPLIKISHQYVDKNVLLTVFKVVNWLGTACGLEGQQIKWVEIADLKSYQFPRANDEIISLIQAVS